MNNAIIAARLQVRWLVIAIFVTCVVAFKV